MDFYIFSTASQDNEYTSWGENNNGIPTPRGSVLIRGGANVTDRRILVTPRGVATKVTAEQYEMLKQNKSFQAHVKAGFITVGRVRKDGDDAAKNMTAKDRSAQLTQADFPNHTVHSVGDTLVKK